MHKLNFVTEKGEITAECELIKATAGEYKGSMLTGAPEVHISTGISLPKSFVVRNNILKIKKSLMEPAGYVTRLDCKGKIYFKDLRNCLPGIFDNKFIARQNSQVFFRKNKHIIVNLASQILDREAVEEIIRIYENNIYKR